jgi:starch synthase
MRIGMLSNSLQGGIWNHSINLSCALGRRGHTVRMVSRNPPGRGIAHHKARALPMWGYELFYRRSGILAGLREMRPGIIHTHHQLGNLDFYLPKVKRLGMPIVSTVHVAPGNESRIDRGVRTYFRRLRKSLTSADRLICVSEYVRQRFLSMGFQDMDVIHNGVDGDVFYREDDARERLGIPDDEFTVLYVGRLSPEKGILHLIRALKGVSGVRLNIIGSGPLSLAVRAYSKKRGNVRFLGRLPDRALRMHYSAADITAFPSVWQEPFGMVLIESMACGTPVVAFRVGGIPEIIQDGRNGILLDERSSGALREAIRYARDNPFPRKASDYCMDYVRRRFTWDRAAMKTEKVYMDYA